MILSNFGARVLVVLVVAAGCLARADDPPKKDAPTDQDTSFAPKPTPEHKRLALDVGVWDATLKFWPPGTTEPVSSKGVETDRMLGDLWVLSDYKGEFAGAPFEGRGQTGYDPKKGKYVGTWVDTMSLSVTVMEGTFDEATKTMTMSSDEADPGSGKPMKARYVTQYKDQNTKVFTMSMKPMEAKDYVKVLEIVYNRRSK
jgi:hypothetical protein